MALTLTEIENLTFAELKERREELLKALDGEDKSELASRYLQARTDAKHRDEKLGEQAKTLEAMTAGNGALQEKLLKREDECRQLEHQLNLKDEDIARLAGMNERIEERLTKEVERLKGELATQTARADAAETLAKARRTALATVMGTISPVLAAE